MARKKHDEALEAGAGAPEELAPEFDSTFEEAQQMLQDAVAQIRAWEPPADYADAHGTAEELGAHRRWRRRIHTDTGEHAVLEAADVEAATNDAIDRTDESEEIEATPVELDEVEGHEAVEVEAVGVEVPEAVAIVADVPAADAVEVMPVDAEATGDPVELEAAEIDGAEIAVVVAAADLAADRDIDGAEAVPTDAGASGPAWDQTEPPVPDGAHGRRRRRRAAGAAAGVGAVEGGDDLAGLGTTYEKRTPRRRRDQATHVATIDSPTADYVLTMASVEPLGPASEPPDQPTTGRRRRVLVAALVAVLVVAGLAVALVVSSGGDDEVASPPSNVKPRLEFPAETTADGMEVHRVWQLEGTQGTDFTGTVELTNPTAAPVTTTYTEVIPKSLASSVSSIRFTPQPVVVKADPVVQWTETLQPGQTFTATYEVTVEADGATRERLLKWQQDRDAEIGTTTTTTTLPPATTTTATPSTAPAATTPAPTTPATTAPPVSTAPPPPPTTQAAGGFIWMSVFNNGAAQATFNFSNGTVLTVPPNGQQSSALIAVPGGVHSVALTDGTTDGITCSNGGSTSSGNTANYSVAPGETVGCTWTAHKP